MIKTARKKREGIHAYFADGVMVKLIYLPPMYYEEYKDMKSNDIAAEVKRRIEAAIAENL